MKHFLLICVLGVFYSSCPVYGQDGWQILSDVTIEKKWDEMIQMDREFPSFGLQLMEAAGSKITLTGFMMPLDELISQESFVLSSLPFQSCFFCGGAGPETVAQINLNGSFKYTDQKITVEGTLRLNDSDPFALYYTLENSKILD
ncbi:MAG: hypothetical protein NXI20_16650 [bacterium]|nr:hypothetical protein [bacterium]